MRGGLSDKIVALHQSLSDADIPHAFGGALALAYCTREPRGTADIDLNVFIAPSRTDALLRALPGVIEVPAGARRQLERDGQARLRWTQTPIDVFLSNHPFHGRAEANRRFVPFAEIDALPVLACVDLAVFKAFFDRPKDRLDVATMAVAGTVDIDELERLVRGLLDADRDLFFTRVREAVADLTRSSPRE